MIPFAIETPHPRTETTPRRVWRPTAAAWGYGLAILASLAMWAFVAMVAIGWW